MRGHRTVGGWLLVLALALFTDAARADSGDPLLIVNSNASIAKYRLLEAEFRRHYDGEVIGVDLGSKWRDKRWLQEIIRRKRPRQILCIGSKAYLQTRELAPDTPTIVTSALNWRRFGVGEATRVISSAVPPANQLTLFRILFPDLRRIGVLYSDADNREWFEKAREAAGEIGVELVGATVDEGDALLPRLAETLAATDALWLIPDPVVLADKTLVEELFRRSEAAQRPVLTYDKLFIPFGAALIISADIPTMARQAVALSKRVGTGNGPAVAPAGSYIALDPKRLERYGVAFNQTALSIVNDIVISGR